MIKKQKKLVSDGFIVLSLTPLRGYEGILFVAMYPTSPHPPNQVEKLAFIGVPAQEENTFFPEVFPFKI